MPGLRLVKYLSPSIMHKLVKGSLHLLIVTYFLLACVFAAFANLQDQMIGTDWFDSSARAGLLYASRRGHVAACLIVVQLLLHYVVITTIIISMS